MKKFSRAELEAMVDGLEDLSLHMSCQDSKIVYDICVEIEDNTPEYCLRNASQAFIQCSCFAQHGQDHAVAFLRRYLEIALKSYRKYVVERH